MSTYGTDKPDTRFGMEIVNVSGALPDSVGVGPDHISEAVKLHVSDDVEGTRGFIEAFLSSPEAERFKGNPAGAPTMFVCDRQQALSRESSIGVQAENAISDILQAQPADLIVLQARSKAPFSGGSTALGQLRLALHQAAVRQGRVPAPDGFRFLWITDFPLFSPVDRTGLEPGQGDVAGLRSTHHPFTSPKTAADVDLLLTRPADATAEHFDLVVNGVELGGGSRRIHDAKMQEFVLKEVLKMPPHRLAEFSHLLEILRAGCPPHAGIALGFDRLVAVMLGLDSVRDVIAFPKNGRGEDPLVKSPGPVSREAWETYHLKTTE
ncbi:MAG: hypothetical protein M1826_000037 [Phylliscum demangeonii]|nr:MAG: hypothetical protein M1826_000037 [Phylliscum demangeonii]